MPTNDRPRTRSTTLLTVRKDGVVAMGGDGQVSMGDTVMKSDARKIRPLMDGRVLTGFAGSAADAPKTLRQASSRAGADRAPAAPGPLPGVQGPGRELDRRAAGHRRSDSARVRMERLAMTASSTHAQRGILCVFAGSRGGGHFR